MIFVSDRPPVSPESMLPQPAPAHLVPIDPVVETPQAVVVAISPLRQHAPLLIALGAIGLGLGIVALALASNASSPAPSGGAAS